MSWKWRKMENIYPNWEIPDSAIARYDATKLDHTDGDSVSQWDDLIGDNTLQSGTEPTYRASGINGKPAVEFGSGTYLKWGGDVDFMGDGFCIMFVMTDPGTDANNHLLSFRNGGSNGGAIFRYTDTADVWMGSQGPTWNPPSTPSVNGLNMESGQSYDVRYNSGQTTGSTSYSFPSVQMGVTADASGSYSTLATVGELIICESGLSTSKYNDEINRLADKWGIAL